MASIIIKPIFYRWIEEIIQVSNVPMCIVEVMITISLVF